MSITVNILYHGQNGAALAFAREMISSGTVAAIRAEDGNEAYEYLIDRWRDQAAIDAHHASPMMQTIAKLRDTYDLHMEVRRFTDFDDNEADATFVRR